jgi:ADP-heptose:LPS heptosyltransferase
MKKAIGFNQGQIGDLLMQTVLCREFKRLFPESHLTFGINKKYETAKEIFKNHTHIDDIKIWDGYDDWPLESDLNYLKNNKYDIVFNPCCTHVDHQWYTKMHHIQAFGINHGFGLIKDLKIELNEWFQTDPKYSDCVAITSFSSAGAVRDIPADFCQKIIDYIHSCGLKTIQLGLNTHQKLHTTYQPISKSIIDDVIAARSCKFLLTTDTGMNWIMSGYNHKVLGLYSGSSYPIYAPLYNRTPLNPNALYLESRLIESIDFETIKNHIKILIN